MTMPDCRSSSLIPLGVVEALTVLVGLFPTRQWR